jgi:sialate O-acetylesterase
LSAVGYFFARELHKELDVPVGMLQTSWGGTVAEAWTSREALAAKENLRPILERIESVKGHQNRASHLYNGMLHMLIPYGIRGAIWYQGESNVTRAEQYATLFPTMIGDWRKRWGQGDFPFYFVQLAPFHYNGHPEPDFLAEQWDSQLKTYRSVPNTGMAVTTDIATLGDIHPPNKQDVGKRLALWALARDYGRSGLVYSGPIYRSQEKEEGKIRVRFDHTGSGLASRDEQPLNEFTVAGADRKFVPAQAKVDGDSILVWSEEIPEPAAVRFGWQNVAQPNLMNKDGLPASPFRTDDWPLKTAGKY